MSIFVSIACFMDNDIVNTIDDCLSKSKNPHNITIGICFQSEHNDGTLDKYSNNKQIKIVKLHWRDAMGPTYARYLISKMLGSEIYFLQIDAHTRFFQNWDETAIFCLKECTFQNSILTAFPICIKKMHEENMPLNISTKKFQSLSYDSIKLGSVTCSKQSCVQTYYLSAAFLFGPSKFLKEVPFDPYLTYSYQSIEQQFYAIRLYTHGWYLFKPSAHIVATYYGETTHKDSLGNILHAPRDYSRGRKSWKRVLYYYGLCDLNDVEIRQEIETYGLGCKKTLNDFFEIHNQSGCVDKIKNGLDYKNGVWSKFNYHITNPIFTQLIKKNCLFDQTVAKAHFEWNIFIKNYNRMFQHYCMSDVSFIDNKRSFFKLLTDNMSIGIPKTYFNIAMIQDTSTKINYFLKYAGNNGGNNVFIYNEVKHIAKHIEKNNKPYIIQEEVPNMLLINCKKFVLRVWIVIVDDKFFLTSNGCCIIHEQLFNKDSLDRKIHIDHDISQISYTSYDSEFFYAQSLPQLCTLSENVCRLIKPRMCFRANCYQVLGLDIIFDTDFYPHIIECNSWPNMSVPYENYRSILEEFFLNFLNDIVVKKLNNEPITSTEYFLELAL